MSTIEQFWALCDQARQLAETTVFSNRREPALLSILEFVQKNPQDRGNFAYCFMHLFHHPDLGPYEIIEYCMRELRWQEVHDYFIGIANAAPDLNCRAVANRIIDAFHDPWPSAGIYARYPQPRTEQV
jgi:hypothetical protein